MNFLDELKKNNTVTNSKGGQYYNSSYNYNLDIFAGISRYNDIDEIISKYKKALAEDSTIALANLLYILDVRNGKGERRLFKTLFRYLCENERELALKVLPFISELGRWDYILEGLRTTIDKEVVDLIKTQLEEDKVSNNPSLLAKWLPSHRTHKVNSQVAKYLMKKLNLKEKQYRKLIVELRNKLNLVECNLSEKEYDKIEFEKVPAKAMLKYRNVFNNKCAGNYTKYLDQVGKGEKEIKTTGLYCYEIIRKLINDRSDENDELYNLMWENQRDILNGYGKNILVVADTSGSMMQYNGLPYMNSVGLAIYMAERNNGIFKNHFITFSVEPKIQQIVGNDIREKFENIESIVSNTDIDKVFELLLKALKNSNVSVEEMPSHIIIISDMEFDAGVYSENGTNFNGWKKAFNEAGYDLPKIVFWNVAGNTGGLPATKFDNDVIMISGFSTMLLNKLLDLEKFSPVVAMIEALKKYIDMLSK